MELHDGVEQNVMIDVEVPAVTSLIELKAVINRMKVSAMGSG